MTILDTTVLIDCFTGPKRSLVVLRQFLAREDLLLVPALVLYEWLRGPRISEELDYQESLFPNELTVPFGPEEAAVAAKLYRTVKSPRSREMDLAIAACALVRDAELWTLNPADFRDIPGLRLLLR